MRAKSNRHNGKLGEDKSKGDNVGPVQRGRGERMDAQHLSADRQESGGESDTVDCRQDFPMDLCTHWWPTHRGPGL